MLSVIEQSEMLSIEDILPFLADFTEIGAFKKDIKASLEKYSKEIVRLQREMDDYTDNANEIRRDTKQLLLRSACITSNRKCDLSGRAVLEKDNAAFVLFPCTHIFSVDELERHLREHKLKHNGDADDMTDECPLCGDLMIEEVNAPFIDFDDEDDVKEANEWAIDDTLHKAMRQQRQQQQSRQNHKGKQLAQHKGKTVLNLEDINIADLGI